MLSCTSVYQCLVVTCWERADLLALVCDVQGLSEPEFYGDLVYKLKKIVGSNNFSAQFIKIISHYKKIGYNSDFGLYDGSDLKTYLMMRW